VRAIEYRYEFCFADGRRLVFEARLDADTLQLVQPAPRDPPAWTRLEPHRCACCPLAAELHEHCPAALATADLVEAFATALPFERVRVEVRGPQRTYVKDVPLQVGVSGLMGLRMAASGCPVLARLRPLVRHHLPFSQTEETMVRVISAYLLEQYLRSKAGQAADWELDELGSAYADVREVNQAFRQRILASEKSGDAGSNALVHLDAMADLVLFSIDRDAVDATVRALRGQQTDSE
jgi:hypothetical protein